MKYYLVAGEASGDLHGSNLMKEILALDPNAEFRFWGGDAMAAVGGTLVSHYKQRAFMGLWEVIRNIRSISGFLRWAKKDILENAPDALILIDNPGFNLRLAKFAKKNRITVHYYIAPKAWAWNEKRVDKIKKNIDFLYSILPFEREFFAKHKVSLDYVGNPVLDAIANFHPNPDWRKNADTEKPIIALLPGSRKNEIERILPVMLGLPDRFPEYDFCIAAAPNFDKQYFERFPIKNAKLCFGQTYDLLTNSNAAVVASGTATLETALFNVPQVVGYKVAWLTYRIGKMLVKLRWFGLVNLILNRELLKELLQGGFTVEATAAELETLMAGPRRETVLKGYGELREILGPAGASGRVAALMVNRTKK